MPACALDLHRRAEFCVWLQLLHHLDVVAGVDQQGVIDMSEGVPTDLLSDADLAGDRLQNLPAQAVRPHRHPAEVVTGEDSNPPASDNRRSDATPPAPLRSRSGPEELHSDGALGLRSAYIC